MKLKYLVVLNYFDKFNLLKTDISFWYLILCLFSAFLFIFEISPIIFILGGKNTQFKTPHSAGKVLGL